MDTWPVILNQSLQGSGWDKVLRQHRMKIRGSNSTIENSVIFPKSGVAFLVIPLSSCTIGQFDIKHEVLQLTEKFTQLHARGYALMLASLHSEREMRICSEIQTKFLETKLQMIAIHNVDEGIQAMINIAKVLCKPTSDVMFRRLDELAHHFSIDDTTKSALEQLGLSEHQIHILQDCLGSLANIVKANKEDLLDCSLDSETADKMIKFFDNPMAIN
ncbi:protein SPO16 homolog [Mytilus trossulus]|uniref:protein SPO16 homolog n=1 Tax=Mytilus trossulus TaxID=6551 RepID=UPI0030071A6B